VEESTTVEGGEGGEHLSGPQDEECPTGGRCRAQGVGPGEPGGQTGVLGGARRRRLDRHHIHHTGVAERLEDGGLALQCGRRHRPPPLLDDDRNTAADFHPDREPPGALHHCHGRDGWVRSHSLLAVRGRMVTYR